MFSIMNDQTKLALKTDSGASFVASFIEAEGPDYDKEDLRHIIRDLLLAGTETSATTLQWALILMANHPDVQKRVQVCCRPDTSILNNSPFSSICAMGMKLLLVFT